MDIASVLTMGSHVMKVNGQYNDLDASPTNSFVYYSVVKTSSRHGDALKDTLTSAATAIVENCPSQ